VDQLILIPFIIIGVLILVFNRRLTEAFIAQDRAFYGSLFGEERISRLGEGGRSRAWRVWARGFVIVFGLVWTGVTLFALVGSWFAVAE
jgi:hypothetical protein